MYENLFLAMEWGFKAHEKGCNLEKAKEDFLKILQNKNMRLKNE